MVKDCKAKGKEDPWLHVEFSKERIELEFLPKNFDYISRCKLHDLVNSMNDNLH